MYVNNGDDDSILNRVYHLRLPLTNIYICNKKAPNSFTEKDERC